MSPLKVSHTKSQVLGLVASVVGVVASILSLGYYQFSLLEIESIFAWLQETSIGFIGAIVGAVISLFVVRRLERRRGPALFIAYHQADREIARQIAGDLRKVSKHVWFDENDIKVGDSISDGIDAGLRASSVFLLILPSDPNLSSGWAEEEIHRAREAGLPILPVKTKEAAVPDSMRSISYADLEQPYADAIRRLRNAVMHAAKTTEGSESMPPGA